MPIDPTDISDAITEIDNLIAIRKAALKSLPVPELTRTDDQTGQPMDIVRTHLSAVRREKSAIRMLKSVRRQLASY